MTTTPIPTTTRITPPRGFLSIRDLFESDLLAEGTEVVYREEAVRRQVRRADHEQGVKDEVYIATGVGGGILLLVLTVSLALITRYRRKFLEGQDSTTFRHNSLDLGPSFTHPLETGGEKESISKIYSLIKPKQGEGGAEWLNPLARWGYCTCF